jgi:hypothetical protein
VVINALTEGREILTVVEPFSTGILVGEELVRRFEKLLDSD